MAVFIRWNRFWMTTTIYQKLLGPSQTPPPLLLQVWAAMRSTDKRVHSLWYPVAPLRARKVDYLVCSRRKSNERIDDNRCILKNYKWLTLISSSNWQCSEESRSKIWTLLTRQWYQYSKNSKPQIHFQCFPHLSFRALRSVTLICTWIVPFLFANYVISTDKQTDHACCEKWHFYDINPLIVQASLAHVWVVTLLSFNSPPLETFINTL